MFNLTSNSSSEKESVFPMLVAVILASNYERISRQGTATILMSKHISCISTEKLKLKWNYIIFEIEYV
jgi:hypothetical protein